MMTIFQLPTDFSFLRPAFLVLLILPIWLAFRFRSTASESGNWEKICDPALFRFLLIINKNHNRRFSRFLFLLGLTLGIIATAGPSWTTHEARLLTVPNPTMFLLSLSGDMSQTDVAPTRLERAKIELSDILKRLPNAESGLIVYTDEPFIISPLSADPALIEQLLNAIDTDIMPSNGDRPDRAIDLAIERMKNAGYSGGQIVLLASEDGTHQGYNDEILDKATRNGFKISVLDFNIEPSKDLQYLAQKGKGFYAHFADNGAEKTATFLEKQASKDLSESNLTGTEKSDGGYFLVFAVLLCFLPLFRRGLSLMIFCFLLTFPAHALEWLNPDYQAQKAFDNAEYEKASKLFRKPMNRGSALYRNQDYSSAVEAFSKADGTEALYNKGNALAKSGKIDEAITTYEEVLRQDPEHEDARFNLEYLKQQQDQDQNQQQNQNSDQNNDQQQQNQNSSSEQDNTNSDEENNSQQKQSENDEQNQEQNEASANTQAEQNPSDNGEQPDDNREAENERQENTPTKDSQQTENGDQNRESNTANESQTQNASSKDEPNSDDEARAKALAQEDDSDDPYDEEVQAETQRFRDIPEDKGGLLRAFIRKEYNKNRYGG